MDKTCEFCCKPLKDADSVDINYTFRIQLISILDYLNLNSGTLRGEDSVCRGCTEKIISSYTFKENCARLEKDLPVLNSHSTKVDLRKLLQDEGKLEQNIEEIQVCRLCWSILDCDAVLPLRALLEKEDIKTVFREHIPEINLQAVKNPVICGMCTNDLNNFKDLLFLSDRFEIVQEEHTNLSPDEIVIPNIEEDDSGNEHVFIDKIVKESKNDTDMKPCIETEWDHNVFDETEEFEAKVKIEPTELKGQSQLIVQLKHEEIHIKSEEEIEVERVTESPGWWHYGKNEEKKEVKLHERAESSREHKLAGDHEFEPSSVDKASLEVDLYKCHKCLYAGKRLSYLKRHILIHKPISEIDVYKCQKCSFGTKTASYLKRHMLVHKAKSEVDVYKCQECSYTVKRARYLKTHMLVHKAKQEVDLYECHKCSYAGKRLSYLKRHILIHKAISEVHSYKCHECSYATKRAGNLKTHMLVHKAKSEVDLYECEECSYAAKHAAHLKRHMLIHKPKSEVDVYKCKECSFITKYADSLKWHMLVHTSDSEVGLYRCHECSLVTKRASYLKRHMLVHKAKSEVDLYKCHKCAFATTLATYLKRHMSVHRAKLEVDLP